MSRLRKTLGVTKNSPWTPEVLAKLGRVPDNEIAALIGLARTTVARKRRALGRRIETRRLWTAAEDAVVRSTTIKDGAARTGRTEEAVMHRRRWLKRR